MTAFSTAVLFDSCEEKVYVFASQSFIDDKTSFYFHSMVGTVDGPLPALSSYVMSRSLSQWERFSMACWGVGCSLYAIHFETFSIAISSFDCDFTLLDMFDYLPAALDTTFPLPPTSVSPTTSPFYPKDSFSI